MGERVGLYQALFSGIADTIYELSGHLLVRVAPPGYSAGAGTLTVESTDRFPSSGKLVAGGEVVSYTGKTSTSFTGITDKDANPGFPVDLPSYAVVMDWSRTQTQIDDLRAAFLLPTAEGAELDTLARNYGIFRPRGLTDTPFRDLLEVMIYLRAQIIYACEQILDILVGAGNYTIWEDLETHPHKVFVTIAYAQASSYLGKTFLVGGEIQTRLTTTTVQVDNPVTAVYGVYASTDPFRTGTNYAQEILSTVYTNPSDPDRLKSTVATFLPGEAGRGLILDFTGGNEEHWKILEVISAQQLRLGWDPYFTGSVASAQPTILEIDQPRFAAWNVGHKIAITESDVGNNGIYTIQTVLTSRRVKLTGATFTTETDMKWQLVPDFPLTSALTASLMRATFSSDVITTPVSMPTTVRVDYVTVPSGQLLDAPSVDGNDQYPFYLFDEGFIVQTILDLITAAGVIVVLEFE